MQFTNLTPHPIVFHTSDGTETTLAPSGTVARAVALASAPVSVPGIPLPVVPSPVFASVEALPPPEAGRVYLVSGVVLAQCAGRSDVFAPATGPSDGALRDERGNVRAVTRLVAAPQG
jgi:hypothetical protein